MKAGDWLEARTLLPWAPWGQARPLSLCCSEKVLSKQIRASEIIWLRKMWGGWILQHTVFNIFNTILSCILNVLISQKIDFYTIEHRTIKMSCFFIRMLIFQPGLVWLSRLNASLWAKGLPVWFPVRALPWVASQVPSRGALKRQPHIDVSLPLFLPPFPSL